MRRFLSVALKVAQWPLASFSPPQAADAVIILGAPMRPDGTLSPIAEERVAAGVEIWRRRLAPVVCVTGGHGLATASHVLAESEGMAQRARSLGVPEHSLRIDHAARSTRENANRSAEILLREGRRRVWIVTQPFHLRRARYHFRKAGFEPLGWHIEDSLQYRAPSTFLKWTVREYLAWGALLLGVTRSR